MRTLLGTALALLGAALAAGCHGKRHHGGPIHADALYSTTCAQCHGPDGHSDTATGRALGAHDLTSPEVQALSDEAIRHQIVFGGTKMPPLASVLDDDEVNALVKYVRHFAATPNRNAPGVLDAGAR